jgi:histone H3/H4
MADDRTGMRQVQGQRYTGGICQSLPGCTTMLRRLVHIAEMAVVITQHQTQTVTEEDIECMLTEVEALSDESTKKLSAADDASV